MLTDQSKVCGKRHIEYSYCCWHHRWLFCFQQIFEIGNQRFPNAKKLSHALARRTELIISFNLKTAPLFFPVKRIILRTQMCRMSVTSFTSGIYTRGSVSRSTIFLKNWIEILKTNACTDTNVVFVVQLALKCLSLNRALWITRDRLICSSTLHRCPWILVRPPTLILFRVLSVHRCLVVIPRVYPAHKPLIIVPSVLSASRRLINYRHRSSVCPHILQYHLQGFLHSQAKTHHYREHCNQHLLNNQPHYLIHLN